MAIREKPDFLYDIVAALSQTKKGLNHGWMAMIEPVFDD
jgi:hypothetical protein